MKDRDHVKSNIEAVAAPRQHLEQGDQRILGNARALNNGAKFYEQNGPPGTHGGKRAEPRQRRPRVEYHEEVHEVAFPSRTQVASTTIAATEAASRRPFANLERRGQQGPMDGRQKAQAEMAAYREEMERARAAEEEQHLMEKARNMAGVPPPQLSYRIA